MKSHYDVVQDVALSCTTMQPLIQSSTWCECHAILIVLQPELRRRRVWLLWLLMYLREGAFKSAWPGNGGRQ